MSPARLQVGRRALAGAERMHGGVDRGEVFGMDELRGIPAEDLLGRVAQDVAHRITAESEAAVAIVLPDPVLRSHDDVAQLLLESHLSAAHLELLERAAHGRHQAREIGLEHVIDRTALQRVDGALFAQRPREEYERSFRRELPGHFERRQAVEAGQREVGEDEVGLEFRERAPQHRLRFHAPPAARESPCFQLPDGDLRFARHIFHEDQTYRLHSCSSLRLVSRPSTLKAAISSRPPPPSPARSPNACARLRRFSPRSVDRRPCRPYQPQRSE